MLEKVSVIISVYNRVHFLKRSLLGLSNQDDVVDELIVSDDGSTEDVFGTIKQVADRLDCQIKYVRQSDQGFRLAKCKNNGIREASGDFLIFIDQDLVYTPKYIHTFVNNKKRGIFLVAFPVRLTQEQTESLNDEMIIAQNYSTLLTQKQVKRFHKQFYKDTFEYYLKKVFKAKGYKPKLRGGVFGAYKDDLIKVDGFDENYIGWGNEDDDLGHRLYQSGVSGKNVFFNQFPIHFYHTPFHDNGKRVNSDYYKRRISEIRSGEYKAINGISNPLGNEKIEVIQIK